MGVRSLKKDIALFNLKRTLMPKPMFILRSGSHALIIRDRRPNGEVVDCSEPAGGIRENNIEKVARTTRTFVTGMTI